MHIKASNSWLYYFLYLMNTELRDMTLFRELLNKKGQRYQIKLAVPFRPEGDSRALTLALREFVTGEMPTGVDRFTGNAQQT